MKLKLTVASILAAFGLSLAVLPATVSAQTGENIVNDKLCEGVLLGEGQTCSDVVPPEGGGVTDVANTVIDVFSLVVGVVSVIVIIVAGLRYIISGGDAGKVGDAKNTILYAVIGLVIVIFAQTIVKWIVNAITDNA